MKSVVGLLSLFVAFSALVGCGKQDTVQSNPTVEAAAEAIAPEVTEVAPAAPEVAPAAPEVAPAAPEVAPAAPEVAPVAPEVTSPKID